MKARIVATEADDSSSLLERKSSSEHRSFSNDADLDAAGGFFDAEAMAARVA